MKQLMLAGIAPGALAGKLTVGQTAPPIQLQTQTGEDFSLFSRQGQGWTVLYFYPKAGTPGCTAQACGFRDAIKTIRAQNAEVYGISTDAVKDLLAFHRQHKLLFTLLSDEDGSVSDAYGVRIPLLNIANRVTFIIDPKLIIRYIDENVDPVVDAKKVAETLAKLQKQP